MLARKCGFMPYQTLIINLLRIWNMTIKYGEGASYFKFTISNNYLTPHLCHAVTSKRNLIYYSSDMMQIAYRLRSILSRDNRYLYRIN